MLNPWDLLLWVFIIAASVVVAAFAVFVVVAIVRAISAPVKGKGSGGR